MKTLIFNGSPRRKGNTAYLIERLKGKLRGETEVINCYGYFETGCIDCRHCRKEAKCVSEKWNALDRKIQEADNIVLASPIYFSNLTGDMMNCLSRTQVYWSARFIRHEEPISKKKKGGLILTYAGNAKIDISLTTARILLNNMNAKDQFTPVISDDTDIVESEDDEKAKKQCDELAAFLNGENQ